MHFCMPGSGLPSPSNLPASLIEPKIADDAPTNQKSIVVTISERGTLNPKAGMPATNRGAQSTNVALGLILGPSLKCFRRRLFRTWPMFG